MTLIQDIVQFLISLYCKQHDKVFVFSGSRELRILSDTKIYLNLKKQNIFMVDCKTDLLMCILGIICFTLRF